MSRLQPRARLHGRLHACSHASLFARPHARPLAQVRSEAARVRPGRRDRLSRVGHRPAERQGEPPSSHTSSQIATQTTTQTTTHTSPHIPHISLHPTPVHPPQALFRRGTARMHRGDFGAAKGDLKAAATLNPKDKAVRDVFVDCQAREAAAKQKEKGVYGKMFG